MNNLRVAIIGAGQVARTSHIKYYQDMDGVEVAAVCDINGKAAEDTAKDFGIPRWYSDVFLMLKEAEPDAVSICVPNKFHCDMTCTALEHGCHVLCEKPPAITVKEAEQMRDTAKRWGKVLTFGFHFRYAERIAFLKKQIENGELGAIYAGDVTWMRRRGIPGWGNFTDKELQGGGPLIDIGVHILDLAVYLMNYPLIDYVCATASDRIGKRGGTGFLGNWDKERFGVEDGLFGFIKFADGSSLNIRTSYAVNIGEKEKRTLCLYGDKKGLSVFPAELYGEEDGWQENRTYPFDELRDWHYDCVRHFVECCREEAVSLVTPDQAVYVQKLIAGLYRSAETGKPVVYGAGNVDLI